MANLVLTIAWVLVFGVIHAYMQELMFKLEGFKDMGWFLTLIQFLSYSCFSFLQTKLFREQLKPRIPIKKYLFIAFLTVSTMGFTNAACGYLNYPTQLMFKSAKLIPVFIGGILIQGKKYSMIDFLACVCMTIGLLFFTLADTQVQPDFNPLGIVLISIALLADAVIGNVQEKTMKQYKSSNIEMVLYSYSIGCVYLIIIEAFTGQLFEGLRFCWKHPKETYFYGIIFSFTGYLSIIAVLVLVKQWGALLAVTVTTMRKVVAIVLSFILFTKPFTFQYVWSGLILVMGVYLNIYGKNKTKYDAMLGRMCIKLVGRRRPQKTSMEQV